MKFEIRQPISQEELEAFHRLRWEVLDEPLGIPWSLPESSTNTIQIAAYNSGETIAVGLIQFNNKKEAQIRGMATRANSTGKGLGSKILTELEKIASSKNIAQIILSARDTAVPFYQRNGFTIVSDLTHPMGLSCKRMIKELTIER